MGIDLNLLEMKKKLSQLNSKGKTNLYIFKPKPGKTIIRIIPYKYNPGNPFILMKFHYDFLKQTLLSPTTFGRPDPIELFASLLMGSGDSNKFNEGRKIISSTRIYVPVIVREPDDPEKFEFKFWGFGKGIYTQLLNILVDESLGYGNIIDPDNGRDIIFEYIDGKAAGNDYGKTSILVKPNTSKLSKDPKKIKEVIENQPKIEDLYEEKSYEELKSLLGKYCVKDEKSFNITEMESNGSVPKECEDSEDVTNVTSSDENDILAQFNSMINN